MTVESSTPLMRQYQAVKQQAPNTLLMFRLGDFYELFFDDAVTAARELEITLTARNKEKAQPIPMCGVPYHAAESYIARLIQRGYRVAICDQMEEAGAGRKLVRRELTKIVTPGTATDSNLLRSRENRHTGYGHRLEPAALAREQFPRRRRAERKSRGTGICRCIDGRVPRNRGRCGGMRANARFAERAGGTGPCRE
jgi:hypothetical protein